MRSLPSIITLALLAACGSVSAADQPEAKSSTTPRSYRDRIGQMAPSPFGGTPGGAPCDCEWDCRPDRDANGEASHEGGAFQDGAKVADDFYLCEGQIWRLDSITAYMATDSLVDLSKARLELYADCDGCPGELLYSLNEFRRSDGEPLADGLRAVAYQFRIADQTDGDSNPLNNPSHIYLKGGTYWVSVVGLSDNRCLTMPMCDSTFWLTCGPVKGSVPKKIFGNPTPDPLDFNYEGQHWLPLDECCIGCTDMAFTVCAEPCKILLDNGGPDLSTTAASLSASPGGIIDARAADDVVAPPCNPLPVCYVSGYLATNCNPPRARLDIFDADCNTPPTFSQPITFDATKITDTGERITVEGRELIVYFVEFSNFELGFGPLILQAGRNYWFSIYGVGTGSFAQRAYALGAGRCDLICDGRTQHFNQAAVSGRGYGFNDSAWRKTQEVFGHPFDLSLLVAVKSARIPRVPAPVQECRPDFNNDGTVTVQDLFDYLNSYFSGCP